jgi:hypothetical protein
MSEFSRVTAFKSVPTDWGGPLADCDKRARAETVGRALIRAREAVAEYLRDLGLRDPDVIARESLRIVDQALCEAASADEVAQTILCERATRLTVKQSEKLLSLVARQSGSGEEPERLGSVIAARLPDLLAQFPNAIGQDKLPDELLNSVQDRLSPVVPPARPQRMTRQRLVLVPAVLKRFFRSVRQFILGERLP